MCPLSALKDVFLSCVMSVPRQDGDWPHVINSYSTGMKRRGKERLIFCQIVLGTAPASEARRSPSTWEKIKNRSQWSCLTQSTNKHAYHQLSPLAESLPTTPLARLSAFRLWKSWVARGLEKQILWKTVGGKCWGNTYNSHVCLGLPSSCIALWSG